ncbi:MAG: hypothetical protein JXM71_07080 [Spirochaetales bacterium]|nr:hypothetical protein [Spirochaetales bacterium]
MRPTVRILSLVAAMMCLGHVAPVATLYAQTPLVAPVDSLPPSTAITEGTGQKGDSAYEVPKAFRGIALGMPMDEVKALLKADSLFSYRGDVDVSLLPRPNESIIEVSGLSFVKRAFFQFYEGALFVMIFQLNDSQIDHYSVFTSLSTKYGKPDSLSPSESVWSDGSTRLSVERPLAIKYIDLVVFEKLKQAGAVEQSIEEVLRTDFLDGL